jgi:hypothetical protein
MILFYPLLIGIVGYALWRAWQRGGLEGGQGWLWFGGWALVGAVFAFSFLTGFTIGLFVLPLVVLLLGVVLHASPRPREAIGFVAGIGAMLLVIAYLNWGDSGGLDPRPWFAWGVAVTAAAIAGYALARRSG